MVLPVWTSVAAINNFEFRQSSHLGEIDRHFEMIALEIDVQGIEVVRARIVDEEIGPHCVAIDCNGVRKKNLSRNFRSTGKTRRRR
jgi:hypothetical protein